MKATISPKKNTLHKIESAFNEFYSRSIYKRMVNDVATQLRNRATPTTYHDTCSNTPVINDRNFKYKATFTSSKKAEAKKDGSDDMPGMLYI